MRIALCAIFLAATPALADPKTDPTCDPKAPAGDAGPLVAHYMCQLGESGRWDPPYPCEIIAAGKSAYLRGAGLIKQCTFGGGIRHGELAATLLCQGSAPHEYAHEASFAAPFRAIAGGYQVTATTTIYSDFMIPGRENDHEPDGTYPHRHVEHREQLTLLVCRSPWPAGFKPKPFPEG
jgi:hypothetical protein